MYFFTRIPNMIIILRSEHFWTAGIVPLKLYKFGVKVSSMWAMAYRKITHRGDLSQYTVVKMNCMRYIMGVSYLI